MKNGKKLTGFFAILAAGIMAALPVYAEDKPDCAALDRQNAQIIGQFITVFAESTGSPLVVKGTAEQGYTVEGEVIARDHSQEAQNNVAITLEAARNILSADKSGCRYLETDRMTSALMGVAEKYYGQISNLKKSL